MPIEHIPHNTDARIQKQMQWSMAMKLDLIFSALETKPLRTQLN